MLITIAAPLAKPAVATYASVALAPLAGPDVMRVAPPNVILAALLISLLPVLAGFRAGTALVRQRHNRHRPELIHNFIPRCFPSRLDTKY